MASEWARFKPPEDVLAAVAVSAPLDFVLAATLARDAVSARNRAGDAARGASNSGSGGNADATLTAAGAGGPSAAAVGAGAAAGAPSAGAGGSAAGGFGALARKDGAETMEASFAKYSSASSTVLQAADDCIKVLEGLEAQHKTVASNTRDLHDKCRRLVEEQARLNDAVTKIELPLSYFDSLHTIGHQLGTPLLQDGGPGPDDSLPSLTRLTEENEKAFAAALDRLDVCIQFMLDHQRFRDAPLYLAKLRQLQMRALSVVKNHVIASINNVAQAVAHELKTTATVTETTETALLYVRFRTQLPHLAPLIALIHKRSDRRSIADLALDCYNTYLDHRVSLVGQVAKAKLESLLNPTDVLATARSGCAYMVRLCQAEYELFHHVFGSDLATLRIKSGAAAGAGDGAGAGAGAGVDVSRDGQPSDRQTTDVESKGGRRSAADLATERAWMDSAQQTLNGSLYEVCLTLSDALRPLVLSIMDVDALCELVHILSAEVVEESIRPRGLAASAMEAVITRLVHDVQERLIYRVQCYVQEDISAFAPTAANLDYPNILLTHYQRLRKQQRGRSGRQETKGTEETLAASGSGGSAQPTMYDTWYPTLQRTLLVLSKVYRCVESSIFESIGQDAVSACTMSFIQAAHEIHKSKSPVDGDMFIIKHLLILREQIAPFEIGFTTTEKRLDFKSTQEALSRLLSRTNSVFTLSRDNPLLTFVVGGIPTIAESRVDSKKDLEIELKHACERFIAGSTQLLAQPLLEFVDKIARFQAAHGSGESARMRPDSSRPEAPPLQSQDFASQAAMHAMAEALRKRLQTELPALRRKMGYYLGSPVTHTILFKPVKNNLMNAFTAWRRALQLDFPPATKDEFLPLLNALLHLVDRSEKFAVDPVELEPEDSESAVRPSPSSAAPAAPVSQGHGADEAGHARGAGSASGTSATVTVTSGAAQRGNGVGVGTTVDSGLKSDPSASEPVPLPTRTASATTDVPVVKPPPPPRSPQPAHTNGTHSAAT